jgi:peptide/nickel transport system substrate-binding protein
MDRNKSIGRRRFLAGGGTLGLGLASAVLIGCSDDEPTPAATKTVVTGTPAATASAATATAAATAVATEAAGGKAGGKITTVFFRARASWDPHRATSPIQVQDHWGLVGNYLFTQNPKTFVPEGDLVESHEWTDGTTLILKLHQNAVWQDVAPLNGRGFTADDAIFNLTRIKDSEWSPRAGLLSGIAGMEATDEHTVRIMLTAPDANFLDSLSSLYNVMVPRELVEQFSDDLNTPDALIGTGAFLSQSHTDGVNGIYVRNPNYWRENRPYLDEVEYLIVPDDSVQFAMFKAGDVDGPARVYPNSLAMQLESEPGLTLWQSLGDLRGYAGVGFRVDRAPFNDVRLRKAVHLALNRQVLGELLNDGAYSLTTPGGRDPFYTLPDDVLLTLPGYREDKAADLVEARKLVQAAGGDISIPQHTGETYTPQNEVVKAQLGQIGIETTLEILPGQGMVVTEHAANNPNFVIMGTERGGGDTVDTAFQNTFHSGGTQNPYGISDPALDAKIDRQKELLDPEERRELFNEIERDILEQVYFAPGTRGKGYMFWKNEVKGYDFGLSGGGNVKAHLYQDVWLDA